MPTILTKDVAPIFDNKPLIRDLSEISNSSINNISGMEVWFDASDLDADGCNRFDRIRQH